MFETSALISVFVTLFVVVDPIGLTPMFIALTQGTSNAHRRLVAIRGCVVAAVLLTVFGLAGETILAGVGITMPAFQIAGGILLFLTALDMLFDRRTKRRAGHADAVPDPSVFPLAMPLIAGPGAMATMILLVGETSDWSGILAVHLAMLAVLLIAFILFLFATPFERALGPTGTMVITRLLGMLLAALSVQFVLNGIQGAGLI
ncbi:MarC family protein [Pararhodobacter sp.]|uniref:MarC family protein n=1 Tax=Pararhodobacter sp. TaxID=2127056 RepID=UPI002AFEAED2|nr:MarC family protein [Pararhodobacter sp.]